MATIVIHVIAPYPAEADDDLIYSGTARCSGMTPSSADISWASDPVAPTATAVQINEAIRDAAVAAAAANDPSYTVGALELKIIVGAATGLL